MTFRLYDVRTEVIRLDPSIPEQSAQPITTQTLTIAVINARLNHTSTTDAGSFALD